jgi:hypothetical protein
VVVLALAACTTLPPSEIRVRDDQFSPYRELATGFVAPSSSSAQLGLQLVAQIDRASGSAKILARTRIAYVDSRRRHYTVARNNKAEQLALTHVSAKGQCNLGSSCPHEEIVAVEVTEADLRRSAAEGYPFKLFAKIGPEVLVLVPKAMVANLLAQIDEDRRQRPSKKAS